MFMNDHNDVLISVILPVYNGAEFLEESILSILNQIYTNFEFIVLNDGSTDKSASIIQKFKDPRIRYYEQQNQGLAATLNRGISIAKGKYLARQDQDDISLPERFRKQIEFLENHTNHGMVGTWASIMEGSNKSRRAHMHPSESLLLKFELLFNNPFVHSSIMIRKSALDKVGLYSTDPRRQPPEDYELWSRVAREFDVANIPEILHVYREVPRSMSRDGVNPFLERVINISVENLAWVTGREKKDRDINDYAALIHGSYHRLTRNPDHQSMSSMLYEAADILSNHQNPQREILRERVRERLPARLPFSITSKYGRVWDSIVKPLFRKIGMAK